MRFDPKHLLKPFVAGLVVFALHGFSPRDARAASGTATGTLLHWNKLGGFCPTSRNCTGAKYLQSEFNAARPIRHVKVYLRDQTFSIIGQGSTSYNGTFTISWYSATLPTSVSIVWHAEHMDNRFVVLNGSGDQWVFWTGSLTPVNGGVTAFGSLQWGTSGSPSDLTNIYDGAHRMWWDSLYWSNTQQADFTSVDIRAQSTECPTGCADGDSKEIDLPVGAEFSPMARVMHEMGHVSEYIAHAKYRRYMVEYCYPTTGSGCSWSYNSPEWLSTGLDEALADLYTTMAFYYGSAAAPHICGDSAVACATDAFNVETRTGACPANSARWPLNALRALWDMYDSNQDISGGYADGASASVNSMHDILALFPDHNWNRHVHEGWTCTWINGLCFPASITDRDARNVYDYRFHYQALTGQSGQTQISMNCQ